jgi:hypothetical protein
MSESKTVMAWPDNEWPDWPTADGQPTTGAKSYGGIVGQIPPPDTGPPDIGPPDVEDPPGIDEPPGTDVPPGTDERQPEAREPGLDFPSDADTPPEVQVASPNAGQPEGEDPGPEHSTGS